VWVAQLLSEPLWGVRGSTQHQPQVVGRVDQGENRAVYGVCGGWQQFHGIRAAIVGQDRVFVHVPLDHDVARKVCVAADHVAHLLDIAPVLRHAGWPLSVFPSFHFAHVATHRLGIDHRQDTAMMMVL
jgi:hypothetical protein